MNDETKLIVPEKREAPAPLPAQPGAQAGETILQTIARVASDPRVDIERLQALQKIYEDIQARESERAYHAALSRAQAEFLPAARKAYNNQTMSHYARLEDVSEAITPALTRHGFGISFSEGKAAKEGEIRIIMTMAHEEGHVVENWIDVPLDDRGIQGKTNKTQIHAKASAITYARRYLKCMVADVSTGDDDDGNAAGVEPISQEQVREILGRLTKGGGDLEKFLAFFDVEKLEFLPTARYGEAIKMLDARVRKNEKKEDDV